MFFHNGLHIALFSFIIGTVQMAELPRDEFNLSPLTSNLSFKPLDFKRIFSVRPILEANDREKKFEGSRHLQSAGDILSISVGALSTIVNSLSVVIVNVAQMTVEILQEISENGVNLGEITDIIGESFVETVVDLSTNVATFLVEDVSLILQSLIKETLTCIDPLNFLESNATSNVTSNASSFIFVDGDDCAISSTITEMVIHGLSDFDFDTFEINDFSYNDNELEFSLDILFIFPEITFDIGGVLESENMCAGGLVEYLSSSSYVDVSYRVFGELNGEVTDNGSALIITSSTLSSTGITGLDTPSTSEFSDIAPYSESLEEELGNAFEQFTTFLFSNLTTFFGENEDVLESFGVELPTTIDLPIPFPF